jgi:hypothetical protein
MKETSKESRISGKFLPVNSADSGYGGYGGYGGYTTPEPFGRGAATGAVGGGRADDGVLSAAGGGEGKSAIAASSEADTALR